MLLSPFDGRAMAAFLYCGIEARRCAATLVYWGARWDRDVVGWEKPMMED